jgi:hypothetical protein
MASGLISLEGEEFDGGILTKINFNGCHLSDPNNEN